MDAFVFSLYIYFLLSGQYFLVGAVNFGSRRPPKDKRVVSVVGAVDGQTLKEAARVAKDSQQTRWRLQTNCRRKIMA